MLFFADTAKAGAGHVPPFTRREDDVGPEGVQLIADIPRLYVHYGFATRNRAAPARTVNEIAGTALDGADVMTAPPDALLTVADHPLTRAGLKIRTRDRVKTGKSVV
ncbi:hypothetical protein M3484_20090 [Pseudomonas sp. GX19020]|uniref:transaldolase family protein n=1 Tax=Pseudomonas sp. GX19020 TaxID=2942277 RepID=UPI0020194648|nr:transaldolase family protein [Pseudomonas sp. GX19020]MCL4068863.1 hypothetical protein [Pseudomonas sp. GX19020]